MNYLGKSQRNTLKSSWLSAHKYSLLIPWVLGRAVKARGAALAVSGSRVCHSPEMVPAEQTLSPGAMWIWMGLGLWGLSCHSTAQGAVEVTLNKLPSP